MASRRIFKVSRVELINNGRLNKRYKEKKDSFLDLGKTLGEDFVFHGTPGT